MYIYTHTEVGHIHSISNMWTLVSVYGIGLSIKKNLLTTAHLQSYYILYNNGIMIQIYVILFFLKHQFTCTSFEQNPYFILYEYDYMYDSIYYAKNINECKYCYCWGILFFF